MQPMLPGDPQTRTILTKLCPSYGEGDRDLQVPTCFYPFCNKRPEPLLEEPPEFSAPKTTPCRFPPGKGFKVLPLSLHRQLWADKTHQVWGRAVTLRGDPGCRRGAAPGPQLPLGLNPNGVGARWDQHQTPAHSTPVTAVQVLGAGTSKWPPNPVSYPRLPGKPVLAGNGGSFCTGQRIPVPASTRPCSWWGRAGRPVSWMLRKWPLSECQGALQKFSSPCPYSRPPSPARFPSLSTPKARPENHCLHGQGNLRDLGRHSALCFTGVIRSLCHRGSSWEMWT